MGISVCARKIRRLWNSVLENSDIDDSVFQRRMLEASERILPWNSVLDPFEIQGIQDHRISSATKKIEFIVTFCSNNEDVWVPYDSVKSDEP